jgi:hypothetical protein
LEGATREPRNIDRIMAISPTTQSMAAIQKIASRSSGLGIMRGVI